MQPLHTVTLCCIPGVITVTVITYLAFSNGQRASRTACLLVAFGRVVKFNAHKCTDHLLLPIL